MNSLIADVPPQPLEWQSYNAELDLRSLLEHVVRNPQDTRVAQEIVMAKGTPMQCVWFAVYAPHADRELLWRHIRSAHNAFVSSQFLRYVPF